MTSRGGTTNVLAGTLTRYGLLVTNIATGVFLMPFTIHHLGRAQYGLWMMVASITYYFSLLDLGYGNGVVRHLVDADAGGDVPRMNAIVSTFVCVYTALAAAAGVVAAVVIGLVVPNLPNLSPADVRTAQLIVAILIARVAIGFPMTVFGAITNARQGFVINNAIAIALVLVNALVTWIVLTWGGGLIMLVATTTAVSAVGYGAYAWSAYYMFPELRIRPSLFSRAEWRDVTSFSLYLFLIGLASQLSFNVDNLVVGGVLGTAAVAVYTVAVRLSEYQRRLCDQFSGMLFPVVVGYHSSGDHEGLRGALVEGARIGLLLVTVATVCLIGFGAPLVQRWMGPGFEGSVGPLLVLALVGVVMVSHGAQQTVLLAADRQRLVAAVWLVEGTINLGLSLLFVRWWGATGVALGTLVPAAIGHLFVMTPAACRAAGLPLRDFARQTLVPAIVGAVPAIVVCALLRTIAPPHALMTILIEGSCTAAVFAGAALLVGLDGATRAQYLAQLQAALDALVPTVRRPGVDASV